MVAICIKCSLVIAQYMPCIIQKQENHNRIEFEIKTIAIRTAFADCCDLQAFLYLRTD